ncbi:hypothetical protein M0802_012025 [Mischocyttarus mexicanus]|nr:hypothetical protein M0802_012025 [Mischocyttarus mexicanus]
MLEKFRHIQAAFSKTGSIWFRLGNQRAFKHKGLVRPICYTGRYLLDEWNESRDSTRDNTVSLSDTMTRLSFQFEMVAADYPKTNIILITSITDEEKQKFEVPRHLGIRKYHTQLETLPEYKKVTATLKRRGQTRCVWFNLNKEILRNYVDDNGNMAIGDYLLEEIQQKEHKVSITIAVTRVGVEKMEVPSSSANDPVTECYDFETDAYASKLELRDAMEHALLEMSSDYTFVSDEELIHITEEDEENEFNEVKENNSEEKNYEPPEIIMKSCRLKQS